jgi:flavin-dependent dehydrogenase
VLGASLSGLFAAAAAAGAGARVWLLERDVLPAVPSPRVGVPQGSQPHVLLHRGLLAAEELLPGLRCDLLDAGAVVLDTGRVAWLGEYGWLPFGQPSFEIVALSRPLFEQVVRARVLALPEVGLRLGTRVSGLHRRAGGWRVLVQDGADLTARLVVDATGRSSRLRQWLAELGLPVPEPEQVDAHLGYATQLVTRGPDPSELAAVVVQATPATLVGGSAFPIERGGWLVTGIGMGSARPPRDPASLAAFLTALPDGALSDFYREGDAKGEVVLHRQTGNRRHRYVEVRNWPDGLLAVGDALCCFNPVYGQGITVAACEAVLLRSAVVAGLPSGSARRLLRGFTQVAAFPWTVATGQDLRMPTSAGSHTRAQAAVSAWAARVSRCAVQGDRRAYEVLMRTYHLMGSPTELFSPSVVASVARARLRDSSPPSPRPAALNLIGRR